MHELSGVNKELSLEWGVNNIVEDCGWSCFVYSKKNYQNKKNGLVLDWNPFETKVLLGDRSLCDKSCLRTEFVENTIFGKN